MNTHNIHNTPNSFHVDKMRLLFFDIFYKNNKIYLIMPIYNKPANPLLISVSINNIELVLSKTFVKDSNEPALIYIYNLSYTIPKAFIDITVTCCGIKRSYKLPHIITPPNSSRHFLTLTTLFKYDYPIFPLFYNYYTSHGVSHFYMYYNGVVTKELKGFFAKYGSNVTLIEWDFNYWNSRECKYPHHAQMGQIHHAIYRYGKECSDYMIFCDLDEYLHIPYSKCKKYEDNNSTGGADKSITLKKFIQDNPDTDIFGFCNIWANTANGILPPRPFLPDTILTVETKNEYCDRSKNIYKLDSIETIGIHQLLNPTRFNELQSITDLSMYHFYNWSRTSRIMENCNIVTSTAAAAATPTQTL
jgi:hypothetical protein